MKTPFTIKKLLLIGFVIFALACGCFIKFQNLQLTLALEHALEQQQKLKGLIQNAFELDKKISDEIGQRREAEQHGFFKKPYPPDLKQIIKTLALQCHIETVFIKFGNLQHNGQAVCSIPVKLTFQSALDIDVFQLIDALKQQNIGLIDVKELNMFREENNSLDQLSLRTELLINIINFNGQLK